MIWWALIFVFLFVLGGILAVRPSPHQRHVAKLREAAMSRGLKVRLGQQLDLPPDIEPRWVAGYIKPRPGDTKGRSGSLRLDAEPLRGEGCFKRVDADLAERLAQLPAGCCLVRSTAQQILVVWDESGELEDIERIAEVIDALESWSR